MLANRSSTEEIEALAGLITKANQNIVYPKALSQKCNISVRIFLKVFDEY